MLDVRFPIPVGADSISALPAFILPKTIRPKVLLPCLGEVATLLFAFKQKANDGVDGGVIFIHYSMLNGLSGEARRANTDSTFDFLVLSPKKVPSSRRIWRRAWCLCVCGIFSVLMQMSYTYKKCMVSQYRINTNF